MEMKELYDGIINKFDLPEDSVIGIFLLKEKYDIYVLTAPLLKEFIDGIYQYTEYKYVINKENYGHETYNIFVRDIRYFIHDFESGEIENLFIFFTDTYYLNEDYKKIIETSFINKRNDISKYYQNNIKKYCIAKAELNEPSKNYYMNYYFNYSGNSYIDLDKWMLKREKMMTLKRKDCSDLFRILTADKKNLTIERIPRYQSIQNGIKDILKQSTGLNLSALETREDRENKMKDNHGTFFNHLTMAEKSALQYMIDIIDVLLNEDNSVNISINKLTKETPLSRVVYTNLLQKMKEYNIAEITNQGVKGFHIIFKNFEYLKLLLKN